MGNYCNKCENCQNEKQIEYNTNIIKQKPICEHCKGRSMFNVNSEFLCQRCF